jgi:hypothetical protein
MYNRPQGNIFYNAKVHGVRDAQQGLPVWNEIWISS